MRRVLEWTAVVVLCCTCAAHLVAGEAQRDARLVEAQAAFDEATKLKDAGKYADAIKQGEHALTLREAVLRDTHPEVASCLNLLGDLHRIQGNPAHAEPLLQRGLEIREAALGKNHPDVATALNSLAVLYAVQGQYKRAEPLLERALEIREEVLGQNHPDVAASLNNLAILYKTQGAHGRAEPLYKRALAIREATLGQNHPDVATSLNNLALLYDAQGQYGRAEPLYERALAIAEAALGQNHPEVARSLNNLALLYYVQGWYGRAEPLHERALAIWEAALGKNHPDVATSLNNLVILYAVQGQYKRAEPLCERALKIREAALGKDHPAVATSLSNLASLYQDQGQYGRAEPLHERALAIREAAFGKNHPEVAMSLNNLASLYQDQGQYKRAAPLYERALAIQEATLGKNHPQSVELLNNLANFYRAQGQYERAEPLLERALATGEAALGKNHPDVAGSLNSLALLRLTQGQLEDALPLFARALALSEGRLRREALGFAESRLASLLELLRTDEEHLYSLLQAYPNEASVQRTALAAVLLLKGRSVEETAATSRTIYQSLTAKERDAFERLRGLRTHLATLSLAGPGKLAPADYQQRIQDLVDQGDALEADLAKRSAPLRALTALPPPDEVVDRVAASLPQDGALVELVAYKHEPLVPKPGTPKHEIPRQLRYLALVLLPDGRIRAHDLGPAAPIDHAASRFRDALAYHFPTYQGAAQKLYELAFRPLVQHLGNTRRIYLAPDGQLGLVPFAALHDGRRFLVETFDFTYLTSGKELLPRPEAPPPARAVVVFADPDFNASPVAPSSSGGAPAERSYAVERFFSTRRDLVDQSWVPLPETRQEAMFLKSLFPQAQLFLGLDATKERLLHLLTPGILHIATHGFFLGDEAAPAGTRGAVEVGLPGHTDSVLRPTDPLLRSGLVLAGAQAAKTGETRRPEDAVVTALELAGLDLWGTELVVLSACNTGRGDVKLGQGIYGLRRAFVVAGAETVVMSLWKVNDETTRALMESYYRNLRAGKGRTTALREAMLALREKEPHPFFWAPFITVGKDSPLRGLVSPTPPVR